ncbi:MAG: hypothetical protein KZQ63_15355 [Candidatus Thiodiazotropha sp. (ex Lucinoma aequizonata)]|nr:hypothetical protein [Candidatus Thiodiazotropha sp. (ex Lucinoma aequizonata)]
MHEQLAVEVQYGIMTYAGRSWHNRLSKIESILVGWDVPKSFTRSKTRLLGGYLTVAVSQFPVSVPVHLPPIVPFCRQMI